MHRRLFHPSCNRTIFSAGGPVPGGSGCMRNGDDGVRVRIDVYNAGFERNRLRELASRFEELAEAIDAVSSRIVDLFQVTRAHYYHPAMRGSWSFRAVLGAVDPGLRDAGFRLAAGSGT